MRSEPLVVVAALAAVLTLGACSDEGATSGVDGTGDSVAAETTEAAPEVTEEIEDPVEDPATLLAAVDITSCKIGEYGVEVKGNVTNPSDEVSDLWGTVEVTNPAGDRIDEAGIIASAVKPGQKVNFDAMGLEDPADLGTKDITCTVLTVDRIKTV